MHNSLIYETIFNRGCPLKRGEDSLFSLFLTFSIFIALSSSSLALILIMIMCARLLLLSAMHYYTKSYLTLNSVLLKYNFAT